MRQKQNLNFMNSIKVQNPRVSVFDLTHDVKLSCNMGFLVPTMVMDCVPGDKVNISTDALVRFAPLVSPMMHRCHVTFHTWAVPYRILWPNWEDYITETKSGAPPVLPAFPYLQILADGSNYTELMDYLGIPTPGVAPQNTIDTPVSAMRFAAYQTIWNEFYRDENLIDDESDDIILQDGSNNGAIASLGQLRKRAWGHDYFTSNLPFAQKGDEVSIPLAFTDADVIYDNDGTKHGIFSPDDGTIDHVGDVFNEAGPVPLIASTHVNDGLGYDKPSSYDPRGSLKVDTTTSTGVLATINDLRLSEQLQKYLERAARAGTRLVEWIKGMFGETLPDYTAQRPQYIGGTKSPVQISEVLQTSETAASPQGNMSGRGISVANGSQGFYHAREHCVILTLMSVMPETVYFQGLEREWSKVNDPKDFLNPLFAHLGEQETKLREIYAYTGDEDETFGYLPRYAEYRTIPNRLAGDFKTTLKYWTMARDFGATAPALNQDFIECDATHRVFADTDPADQKLYVQCLNRIRAVRPLPKYGTPSL